MATNYEKYLQALEDERNREVPVYTSQRQNEIDALVNDIRNARYSYEQSNDPKAANANRVYTAAAQRAMRDTLGTTSAMTGGRPSSYAQSAAQQAYSRQMEGLNTYLDQLEQAAYSRYQSNLAKKEQDLANLQNLENADYARWQNEQKTINDKRQQDINYLYNLSQVDAANAQAAATQQATLYQAQQDAAAAQEKQRQNEFAKYKQQYQNATSEDSQLSIMKNIWNWAKAAQIDADLLNALLVDANISLDTFTQAVDNGFSSLSMNARDAFDQRVRNAWRARTTR